jgi:RimJ/RimL family protein N-acetyltransferase
VDRVISLILPENAPSRGVAEHLGMTVWKDVTWGTERPMRHHVYRLNRPKT